MKPSILITIGVFFFMFKTNLTAQYNCSSPVVISSLPYIANNLTTSTGLSYQASGVCNVNYNEQDYIFQYSPMVEEELTITLNFIEFVQQAGIYVFTGCSQPPTNCVAFVQSFLSPNMDLAFSVVPGIDYYIFVGSQGTKNFNIDISKTEVIGVAINKSAPTQTLDVNGSLRISESQDIPYAGTLKWNDADKLFQGYDGTNWEPITVDRLANLKDVYYDNSSLLLPLSSPITNYNGGNNTSVGIASGGSDNGFSNSFFGGLAGAFVDDGSSNVYIGFRAGFRGTSISENVYVGAQSGDGLPIAGQKGNTYLGYRSGYNASPNLVGSGNVFLGWQAGEGMSLSNKLIIDNSNLNYNNLEPPLIYGDFEDNFLLVNRNFRIDDGEVFGVNGGPNEVFPAIFINAIPYNARPYYGFAIAGEERARILYDGFNDNIRLSNIGTFFNFLTDGNATKAVAGSWMANSDARLKKNIQTLDKKEMLEKLLTMKGVQYEWDDNRNSYNRPEGLQIGFIAQDLQEIWPGKIKEDEDGYLMTAYGDYDPIFVESIKALNDKITKQEKTIESLIQKLAELERLIKSGTTSGKNQNTN